VGYLAPLLGGVAGGLPFVIDNSAYYNQLILPGEEARYGLVLGGVLAVAFTLMCANLAAQIARGNDGLIGRAVRVARRVLPIFLGAYALSSTLSACTLWALGHTDVTKVGKVSLGFIPQFLLWAALSLFFGVFINLFVAGTSAARRD
jgi:hypothetical protein